jgi:hypothetical protein
MKKHLTTFRNSTSHKRSPLIFDAIIDYLETHGETSARDLAEMCECSRGAITNNVIAWNLRLAEQDAPFRLKSRAGAGQNLILSLIPKPVRKP